MFTRQHYVATAAIVADIADVNTRDMVANRFVDMFESDNPRFDELRFLAACGAAKLEREEA